MRHKTTFLHQSHKTEHQGETIRSEQRFTFALSNYCSETGDGQTSDRDRDFREWKEGQPDSAAKAMGGT
jgi:hypothetical protein